MTTNHGADVGVLLTPRDVGGHEIALLGWLADAVQRDGLRPTIVAPSAALLQACTARGLSRWVHPHSRRWAAEGRNARVYWGLARWAAAWPAARPLLLAPGVVHSHAWLTAAALAAGCQVWLYVPMAWTAATMGYRGARWRDAPLAPWLRRVAAWVTIDAQQADVLRRVWRVTAPVYLVPNLARIDARDRPTAAPHPSGDDPPLRVACVGRFDLHQKGLDWLTTEIRQRPEWQQRLRWRFQGWGPGEAVLRAAAAALAPGAITVAGRAPLRDALAVSDVLLLPSRYEGLPLVALEATALGWPVVASRSAGLNELLPATCLFDAGDADGLQAALARLRTPAARAAAVAEAQRRVDAPSRQAAQVQAVAALTRALQGPAGAAP
jgi:glycosyltransferase involved in cell wall biosynthesis